jgi:hypothetical protein
LPEKQIKWVMGSFGVHYILKTFRLIFNWFENKKGRDHV